MCGITGKYFINHQHTVEASDIQKMTRAIAHRGSDDEGIKILGNIGLGHRRLSIIDLSKRGHQPMTNKQKSLWITFNGEIYNYQELKAQLLKKGYKFYSETDTEVILAAYQEYGTDCVKSFRGMFSFAIYDVKKDLLFAARDRLGKKPFKYYFDGKVFIFASELKAILTQVEVSRNIDSEAIKQYIYWGFVPSPKTGFLKIHKLPAAHMLVIHKGSLSIQKYWDYKPIYTLGRTEEETISQLRNIFEESIKLRMVSDVPLGAFLSGGIDSCVVIGMMSRLSSKPIKTYTIGFDGWKDSEIEPARITAKFHHTDHHEFTIKPDIESILPKIAQAYEEPFGDASAVPSYYVSKTASEHVKVVLNGDGGDENFLGYSNYTTLLTTQRLQPFMLPAKLTYQALKPLQSLLSKNLVYHRLLRVSHLIQSNPLESYSKYARGYLNLISSSLIYNDSSFDQMDEIKRYLPQKSSDLISAIMYLDLHNILPDGLMSKIDIASMQFGLEARSPLLDQELVEFAATIPLNMKYKNKTTKYILRKAFADLIPPEINKLPKRGFVMPTGNWIKNELKSLTKQLLLNKSAKIYEVLNFETIQQILQLHWQTETDFSAFIWRFIMLELWYREYL